MKASVYTRYGSPEVLQLVDIPKPTPRDHEVLVKVHATTVTIGDTIMRSFKLSNITGWQKFMARLILGWNKPKRHILGMELSGEIESIGRKVTRFKPGDAVFASTYDVNFGGHAEYKCLPEKGVIALKPGNLTFEEAAAIPGGGARSPLWRQILADILQVEVVTVNTTEGAAYGAALLAATGAGVFRNVESACDMSVKITGSTSPNPVQMELYQKSYQVYRRLYPALKSTFHKI